MMAIKIHMSMTYKEKTEFTVICTADLMSTRPIVYPATE